MQRPQSMKRRSELHHTNQASTVGEKDQLAIVNARLHALRGTFLILIWVPTYLYPAYMQVLPKSLCSELLLFGIDLHIFSPPATYTFRFGGKIGQILPYMYGRAGRWMKV